MVVLTWNRKALLSFFVFALAAKRFTRNGDWLVPLDTWLSSLPVGQEAREKLLLPLLSAMMGCSIEETRGFSARGALVFVGRALPDNLLAPFVYSTSLVGLGGNARFLAGISGNLTTHLGSPVASVDCIPEGGFAIGNAAGVVETVDLVIFATPPYVSRLLLPDIPGRCEVRSVLELFPYFRADISIHRDPVYMSENPRYWSTLADGSHSEASIWYGALRPAEPGQAPLLLFKSWATARARAPEQEIFRREFLHPLITPDFIEGQRRLAAYQGRAGVWFAGSYTNEVDSQETALLSAMNIVRELDPEAPNLLALES